MEEKILTQHPEGKHGVNISKKKYEHMKNTLLIILREQGEMTFTGLTKAAREKLNGKFDGNIAWYAVTVKLDLEARGIIERVRKASPQRIRLSE